MQMRFHDAIGLRYTAKKAAPERAARIRDYSYTVVRYSVAFFEETLTIVIPAFEVEISVMLPVSVEVLPAALPVFVEMLSVVPSISVEALSVVFAAPPITADRLNHFRRNSGFGVGGDAGERAC